MASDPTLRGTLAPAELAEVAAAVGLDLTAEDVQALVGGPGAAHDGVVSCEYKSHVNIHSVSICFRRGLLIIHELNVC